MPEPPSMDALISIHKHWCSRLLKILNQLPNQSKKLVNLCIKIQVILASCLLDHSPKGG